VHTKDTQSDELSARMSNTVFSHIYPTGYSFLHMRMRGICAKIRYWCYLLQRDLKLITVRIIYVYIHHEP